MNSNIIEVSGFTYRRGNASDAAAVQLLIERATAARNQKPIPSSISRPEYVDENRIRLSQKDTWSKLVFDNDKLIGFIVVEPSTDETDKRHDPKIKHITLLMIDPEYWGQGLGGRLLDLAEHDLAKQGTRSLELETGVGNVRSRALYERKDYQLTGKPVTKEYGDQIHYQKSLT